MNKKQIALKIDRDDLRSVEREFLPYLVQYCKMKVYHCTSGKLEDQLNAMTIYSLLLEAKAIIAKKLKGKPNRWTIKFTHHHAATLYRLLMNLPVPAEADYLIKLRSNICDAILKQFNDPQKQLT